MKSWTLLNKTLNGRSCQLQTKINRVKEEIEPRKTDVTGLRLMKEDGEAKNIKIIHEHR